MTDEPAPAPKSILLAIGIEAHHFKHALAQLREIEYRLMEADDHGDILLDVTSGSGWFMRGDRDPDRTEESYTAELMAWFDRRKAVRKVETP